jgi:flagellar hook assembly protein FlgD
MSQVPSLASSSSIKPFGQNNTLNELNLDSFLKLLITELQNQDPLNPLDNSEMLAQIHQIRQIGATDKLTSTLDSVLLGQNIASSTGLIGQDVNAISDNGERVSGTVSRVSIESGVPKLRLDSLTSGEPSDELGKIEKGTYSYRIIWEGPNSLEGIELSGNEAISTEGSDANYQSIRLRNLPATAGAKYIYRTDKTGDGEYRLVGVVTDGKQSSFHDKVADNDRNDQRQSEAFVTHPDFRLRSYKVSLRNVSDIFAHGT